MAELFDFSKKIKEVKSIETIKPEFFYCSNCNETFPIKEKCTLRRKEYCRPCYQAKKEEEERKKQKDDTLKREQVQLDSKQSQSILEIKKLLEDKEQRDLEQTKTIKTLAESVKEISKRINMPEQFVEMIQKGIKGNLKVLGKEIATDIKDSMPKMIQGSLNGDIPEVVRNCTDWQKFLYAIYCFPHDKFTYGNIMQYYASLFQTANTESLGRYLRWFKTDENRFIKKEKGKGIVALFYKTSALKIDLEEFLKKLPNLALNKN